MNKPIKLSLSDIKLSTNFNSDCGGAGFTWDCPDCDERLAWAPDMWWRNECCREWDFKIIITGKKISEIRHE